METIIMFCPRFLGLILLAIGSLALPGASFAQRPLDSELTLEILQRMTQLEAEVRQIRGELEIQRHQLELLQPESGRAATRPTPVGVDQASAGRYAPPAPVVSTPPPVPAPRSAQDGTEQADFDAALGELREGRYPQAIVDLQRFVSAWPNSSLAGDAQYWLGESCYLSRNYDGAKEAFINLGLHYPHSARLPDALLKLGYIYGEQGDATRTREVLHKLIQVYPNSQAAGLAERRLQSLR
jgi:tol-pal system protein YbgF